MEKTLYITDLDGTLLNPESKVSDYSVSIINELIDKGALFSVATARTQATVVPLLKNIHINIPVVLMTGAVTYDIAKQEYIDVRTFSHESVKNLIDILDKHNQTAFIYCIRNNHLYVYYRELKCRIEKEFIRERENTPFKTFIQIHNFRDILSGEENIILFLVLGKYKSLETINNEIKNDSRYNSFCYHDIFDYSDGTLEIYSPGTSKAEAIQRLSQRLNINKLVSFGDNLNDLPMFAISDECYATGNAMEEVKTASTAIIEDNAHDGVARFLSKNIE